MLFNNSILDTVSWNYIKANFLLASSLLYVSHLFTSDLIFRATKNIFLPILVLFIISKGYDLYGLMSEIDQSGFTTYFGEQRFGINLNSMGVLALLIIYLVDSFYMTSTDKFTSLTGTILKLASFIVLLFSVSRMAIILSISFWPRKIWFWLFLSCILFFYGGTFYDYFEVQLNFFGLKLSGLAEDGTEMRMNTLFLKELDAFFSKTFLTILFGSAGEIKHNFLISVLSFSGIFGLIFMSIFLFFFLFRYKASAVFFAVIFVDFFISNNIQNLSGYILLLSVINGVNYARLNLPNLKIA